LNRARLFTILTEKWHVKVLSLAAAIIIAVFYRMNSLETRFFTVPLVIEANETLLPANSFPRSVKITLRGEAEGIQPILAEDIEAYIDLEKYLYEGNYRVPILFRKKGTALGVEPLEISSVPIDIPLTLEEKMTRNISVFPVLRGKVADGYELTSQSLNPSSVMVEGPKSLIDSHIEFDTEPIDLDRRHENFSIMVNIKNDNSLLSIHGSNILEFRGTINRIAREEYENNFSQLEEAEHLTSEEQ